MNRKILLGTTVIVVLAGLYLASKIIISVQVANYVDETSRLLISHDEFQVNRIDYDGGLRGGELHYDLIYRPLPDTAAYLLLDDFHGSHELLLQGSIAVDHGPLFMDGGLGLARADLELSLPDELRQWLPQYPGQTPLFTMRALSRFDGNTQLRINVVDYDGRLRIPEEPVNWELVIQDAYTELTFDPALDYLASDAGVSRLRLGTGPGEPQLNLTGVSVKSMHQRAMPYIWEGDARLAMEEISLGAAGESVALEGLQLMIDTRLEEALMHNRLQFEFGAASVLDTVLDQGRLIMTIENVNAVAYADLMALIEPGSLQGFMNREATIQSLAERLLTAGPRLAIDELSVSVAQTHDTRASVSLGYDGPTRLNVWDVMGLPTYLDMHATAQSTEGAIHKLAELFVAEQYATATAAEQAVVAGDYAQEFINMLLELGFVRDGDGVLRNEARLVDGRLQLGLDRIVLDEDVVSLLLDLFLSDAPTQSTGAAVGRDHRLSLDAGFTPDPYDLIVMAGGQEAVPAGLGNDCIGYTVLDSSNVVLDYSADGSPLYISAIAGVDTALIVQSPDGEYHCNDDRDAASLDPAVEFFDPQSGIYRIWVTAYAPGEDLAVLAISELGY